LIGCPPYKSDTEINISQNLLFLSDFVYLSASIVPLAAGWAVKRVFLFSFLFFFLDNGCTTKTHKTG